MSFQISGNISNSDKIIVLAVGLCGTEKSPYAEDIINTFSKDHCVITIRSLETSTNSTDTKFFVKNDISHILNLFQIIPKNKEIIGVGVSMGGALLLQCIFKCSDNITIRKLFMISTSLYYEHAILTMNQTLYGLIASKMIISWQLLELWKNPNFLHKCDKMNYKNWFKLLFANNMLEQDKILCELYDLNYDQYIKSLDLRNIIKEVSKNTNIYYLVSNNDPMFSKEHLELMKQATENCKNIISNFTDIGNHGEFTIFKRNDYMIHLFKEFLKM